MISNELMKSRLAAEKGFTSWCVEHKTLIRQSETRDFRLCGVYRSTRPRYNCSCLGCKYDMKANYWIKSFRWSWQTQVLVDTDLKDLTNWRQSCFLIWSYYIVKVAAGDAVDPGFKGECRSRAIVKGEFSRLNLNFTALPDCDTFVVQNSPLSTLL